MKQTILKYSSLLALLSAPFLSTQMFAAECATGTSPAAGCTIDVSNTTYTLTGDLGSTALFEVIEFGNGANFNTLNLLGNITTANADAIYFGDSDSNTISMTGNITTTLLGATGINLSTGSRANVIDLFGNITTGEDSQAIALSNTNDNTITVIGNLTTSANAAAGIGLTSASDNTVNITGNINNDGSGITMIEGEGNAINVTGNIDTADTNADGVDMENTDSNTINITGNVTTINSSANGFILFDANRNTINLTGNITTSESDSLGIDVRGDSNTTTINGNISTTGATSSGMFLRGNSNTTTINGNISTTKDDSLGIDLSLFGSNTTTINGNITTKGEDSHGIDHSSSAQNTTNMTGNISTTGVQATGMRLSSSNNNNTNMTGDITTTGRSGMGIFITRANENTTVLTGDILTSGDLAHGIHLQQSDSNTTSVHGNISTTGSRAHGVWVEDADNNTFVITGNISTSGTYEAIFIKRSDSNTFNLSGKIQSLGVDQAIDIDGDSDGNAFIVESGATFLGDFVNYGTNTVITNQGTMDGIENTGSIATFNNYQKGLTYSGTLPDNYTTIIDDSGYGQLFVSNEAAAAAGATAYTPFAGAANIGVAIKSGTYTNVMTGISSANIGATRSGTLTGDATSSAGSTAWTLTETASGSNAWNLNTTGNYFYFGSVAALQNSIDNTANYMRGAFNSITTSMNFANMTTYDCNLFGNDGSCVSVGGRYTGTDNRDTTATAVVAKVGYKFNEHFRYGAFVDQTANSKTGNVDLDMHTPMVGFMGVWNQNSDQLGMQVKLANTYQQTDATITRNGLGNGDDYRGDTDINAQSYVAELSWRHLNDQKNTLLQPFVATRYAIIDQDGYSDGFVNYGSVEQKTLTALVGVKAFYQYSHKMTYMGSLGVEHDLDEDADDLSVSVSGVSGLTAASITDGGEDKTRFLGSVGARFFVTPNQRLEGKLMYEQLRYNNADSTTAYVNYTIGF